MGEIPFYSRNQLPPAGGRPKPSMELADRSGQIAAGQAIAGTAGNIFQELLKTRANNEHHEFLGLINTAQSEFRNYIKQNPSASLEDMQKAKEKMFTGIDAAGNNSQTQIAKEANKNFMLLNRDKLEEDADGDVQEIVSKHEFDRYKIQADTYLETGDYDKLVNITNGAVNSGLLNKDTAAAYLENAKLETDAINARAQKEAAVNNAYSSLTEYAQSMNEAGENGWDKALEAITDPKWQSESGLDAEDVTKLTNMIENQQIAYNKTLIAEQNKIEDDFNKRKWAGEVPDFNSIDNSSLSADKKEALKQNWQKFYRGEDRKSDPIVAAAIKERINNLYRGKETADKIIEDIRKEFRAGNIVDSGDDKQSYSGLLSDATTKWTSVQSDAIKSAYEKAKDTKFFIQIDNTNDAKEQESYQYIAKYLNEYDSALKGMIRANPDWSIKEIDTQADMLRRKYSDMAFAEISKIESDNVPYFSAESPYVMGKFLHNAFVYNKDKTILQIEGKITVTKDGKKFNLPKEQLDEALKQGYTLAE
jgi:hypothetical protein